MRKNVVMFGVVLLFVAMVIPFALSVQEPSSYENVEETWDLPQLLHQEALPPGNDTFLGRYMQRDWWFQLNLATTSHVRVTVSVVKRDPDRTEPIWTKTSTSFTDKVSTPSAATYYVEIRNVDSSPASINGTVQAKSANIVKTVLYPYAFVGFVVALGGVGAIILGALSKPGKRPKLKHG